MIAALLSLLGSSAVGSIIGGLFGFLNRKTDIDLKRLDMEHERAKWTNDLVMRDKDIAYAQAEAQGRKDVSVIEADAAIESARMNAIAISHQSDKISADEIKAAGSWGWLLVLGSALRAFIRPVITIVLTGAACYLNWLLIEKLTEGWASLTTQQQYEAAMQAFAWITGQAGAVLGYWFVSRGNAK